MDTLAFIKDPAASKAMLGLSQPDSPAREQATVWLLNRMSNDWADHGLRPALKAAGIYDPDTVVLRESIVPRPAADLAELSIEESVRLTGDAARGKNTVTRCLMCHASGGTGAELGPALDGWGRGKSAEVIATALIRPSAEIAHGYEGMELRTKDGLTIQGVLIKEGNPLMMRSMGGITQIIPADRVANAPADAAVADDERRAAGSHDAGRRRYRGVPAEQLSGLDEIEHRRPLSTRSGRLGSRCRASKPARSTTARRY